MPRASTSGGATPMPEMPDRTSFLAPAWDPLSCTPRYSHSYFGRPKLTAYKIYRTVDPSSLTPAWNSEDRPLATDGQIASEQPDQPQHPLLDVRLVGARLKVVVNDGESYKNREVAVSIVDIEGAVSIRHHVYNTSKGLAPAWVSSKVPIRTATTAFSWLLKANTAVNMLDRYHEDDGS